MGLRASIPALALLFALSGACSSSGGGSGAGGSCPCDVGNSGLHFTIPCGKSSCITLNGQVKGYRCEADGAHEDMSVCTSGTGGSGGGGTGGTGGPTCATCDVSTPACGSSENACAVAEACATCNGGGVCSVQNACITAAVQSVAIFGDYSGGTFTIDVDQHVPGLAIGLVSYRPMQVTITGQYASDVVAVFHAGYQPGTTVSGVSPADLAEGRRMAATGAGANLMLCDAGTIAVPSCASPAQVEAFFTGHLGGSVLSHMCQHDAYSGTLQLSAGSSCQ